MGKRLISHDIGGDMDKSNTIDRHTPNIPESIWQGLSPDQEATYTAIKNQIILPNSGISMIANNKRSGKTLPTSKRTIDDSHLLEAQDAIKKAKLPIQQLLAKRSITVDDANKYNMLDTRDLVQHLSDGTVAALTLKLPPELPGPHDLDGISIPIYSRGLFMGFATWIVNNDSVKYAFSIPNRFCFGDDDSKSEVTIVEGLFDAIALDRVGINAMALGDSQPNYFKMLMASKYDRVRLLFDNDLAGTLGCLKAFLILTKILRKPVKDIVIISTTNQDDPEAMVKSGGVNFPVVDYDMMVDRLDKWDKSWTHSRNCLTKP